MIELDRLIALALGELNEEEAAAVEEHVLGCDSCATNLSCLLDIGDAVREVVREGRVRFALTSAMVSELERGGLIARTYRIAPGGSVACSVGAEDVYHAACLEADLQGVQRVDAIKEYLPGQVVRITDVPFDAEQGLVRLVERGDFLRTLPSFVGTIRLVAVDDGSERTLGTYVFNHVR